MKKEWAVMVCDCGYVFAIKEEPKFQSCPNCGSEDTQGTGEYLDSTLYTENGKKIQ
jgi:Zn finger protein HypA/HybF involved in hydrogenase expression